MPRPAKIGRSSPRRKSSFQRTPCASPCYPTSMPTSRHSTRALRMHAPRGLRAFALLGDFVGYGADAVAVVDAVMRCADDGAIAIKGNHDEAIEPSGRLLQ